MTRNLLWLYQNQQAGTESTSTLDWDWWQQQHLYLLLVAVPHYILHWPLLESMNLHVLCTHKAFFKLLLLPAAPRRHPGGGLYRTELVLLLDCSVDVMEESHCRAEQLFSYQLWVGGDGIFLKLVNLCRHWMSLWRSHNLSCFWFQYAAVFSSEKPSVYYLLKTPTDTVSFWWTSWSFWHLMRLNFFSRVN